MEMIDDGPKDVKKQDFIDFINKGKYYNANIGLEIYFPKGMLVKVNGLQSKVELNDKIGQVTGNYANGRVGVEFLDF